MILSNNLCVKKVCKLCALLRINCTLLFFIKYHIPLLLYLYEFWYFGISPAYIKLVKQKKQEEVMKNFKKFTVILAVVALTAGTAFAYGPGMGGQGQGFNQNTNCPNYGQGFRGKGRGMRGQGGFGNAVEVKQISQEDATKQLNDYVTANLKGFEVKTVQSFEGRRGTAYFATVTDINDNKFQLRLTPFGDVRGPFLQK